MTYTGFVNEPGTNQGEAGELLNQYVDISDNRLAGNDYAQAGVATLNAPVDDVPTVTRSTFGIAIIGFVAPVVQSEELSGLDFSTPFRQGFPTLVATFDYEEIVFDTHRRCLRDAAGLVYRLPGRGVIQSEANRKS